jgi:two-component system C4-dicarboxylate transport sensor histidine kinase DctB
VTGRSALASLLQRPYVILSALALVLMAIVGWVAFETTLGGAVSQASQQADRRLALFDRTLAAIIDRYHYLPDSVAFAAEARLVLDNPLDQDTLERANGFLSKLNDAAGAGELFIMALNGDVVAASNWWAYDSFVGENLGFRPYFEEAMRDGDAKFYALGTVTGVAGYFLAKRIDGPEGPLGVAVTKINLGEIEATWWRSGELIVIVDNNNVAILSTRPDWRYRPLAALVPSDREQILAERRYGEGSLLTQPIALDQWTSNGTGFASIDGSDPETEGQFLVNELRLPAHQWRLVSFTPAASIFQSAWALAIVASLAAGAALLIALLVVQRQRLVAQRLADHDRLEQRVAERTEDLHIFNEALLAEIAERTRAEQAREQAQHSLVQAAKLASLGEALAGVAHEVSQPVAALTTHLASAKLMAAQRQDNTMTTLLVTMDKVVDRLAALTAHLKNFARKQTHSEAQHADFASVVANALDLVDHKLKAFGVDVEYRRPRSTIKVTGNPIHLEQVLINLISNAVDAMEHVPLRVLSIGIATKDGDAELVVSDTGSGIAPEAMGNLFDPFYSTKQAGRGLGLGLSISYGLIRDLGGTITVQSRPGQGATFAVRVPLLANAPIRFEEAAQ